MESSITTAVAPSRAAGAWTPSALAALAASLIGLLGLFALAGQEAEAHAGAQFQGIFSFRNLKGEDPMGGLVADAAGNLYGTAFAGGRGGVGLVYELSPPAGGGRLWTETVLHVFHGADGADPYVGLLRDASGNLYGTTELGGPGDHGVVFEVSPPVAGQTRWKEKVLFAFDGDDGKVPIAGLIADPAGNLYGTANGGGAHAEGVVYELSPPNRPRGAWRERILHAFHKADGQVPDAGLLLDGAGNLYGTTADGGANGAGVVFELSPPAEGRTAWTETVIHAFDKTDGQSPSSPLIADEAGNLYGVAVFGGPHPCQSLDCGLVYELSPPTAGQTDWTETVLFAFNGTRGYRPYAGLLRDGAGNLYGVTSEGGVKACKPVGCGVVFRLNPPAEGQTAWTETVLHDFGGGDGSLPYAALIADPAGNLYGVASAGGPHSGGVAFKITP